MKIFKVFVLALFMVVAFTQAVAAGVIFNSVTFNYNDTSFIRLYFDGVTEIFAPANLTHADVVSSGIFRVNIGAEKFAPAPRTFNAEFIRRDPFSAFVHHLYFHHVFVTDIVTALHSPHPSTMNYRGGSRLLLPGLGGIVWDFDIVSDVPEPGSHAMLGLGLAGLGYSRRKSRLQA
jgi:hypothetical protein